VDEVTRARLASKNRNKLRELSPLLPWELRPLEADSYPPEEGETYYENALAKARFGRTHAPAGEWVIGEDSGLEVAALDGRPGVLSARYAPEGAEAVAKLLDELRGVGDRRAHYVCELVAVDTEGREHRGTGMLEGRIAEEARGSEGFGYDPIFVPEGEERTVAELGNDWKSRNSHRARAAQALRAHLSF
jgi:XTP/dITP diphosphohydrolase